MAAEIIENLDPPRLYGADANHEGIVKRLDLADGRFLVAEPEGTLLENVVGRHTEGRPAFEYLLKTFDGDPVLVDHQSSSVKIAKPALSMAIAVQPDVLRGLASKSSFLGWGFWGRMLFAKPDSQIGARSAFTEEPDPEVIAKNGAAVRCLYMQDVPQEGGIITPTPEAWAVCADFFNEIEPSHGDGGAWSRLVIGP